MKTLLVPVDFSDATTTVLDQAAGFARALEAHLVLLHVVEPMATYVPVGAAMDVLAATAPPEAHDSSALEARLNSLASPIRAAGLEAQIEVVVGLAADEILDRARHLAPEAIVMGSHGHGALYHLFSGSVVNGVLKHAPCPVLIIPSPSKA
jgi:nucleotide-binding universal stress UspA family protein